MSDRNKLLNRRDFLRISGFSVAGVALAACAPAVAPAADSGGEAAVPDMETYIVNHWSWLSASDAEVWGQHTANFNEAHADQGIQIEQLNVNSDEVITKVVAAAATGQAPDFGWSRFGAGGSADFIKDGVTVELGGYLADAGLDWDDITELSLADSSYPQFGEGKYHLPMDAMTWEMLINLDHVEEAGLDAENVPTTGEEMLEWAKAMTVMDGDSVVRSGFLMTGSGLHVAFIWGLVAYQMGFRVTNPEQTEACINADALKEAAQWTLDLFDVHKVATLDVADRYKTFGTNDASLFITGPWTLNGYVEQGINFTVAFTPNIGGELATRRSIGAQEMYLQEDESRYARSAETLKWLSDESFLWTTVGRGAACRKSILERDDYKEAGHGWELRGPFVEGMEFATFNPPKMRNTPDMMYYTSPNLVHRIMDPVWQGERDIDSAVDELCAEWNRFVKEENV